MGSPNMILMAMEKQDKSKFTDYRVAMSNGENIATQHNAKVIAGKVSRGNLETAILSSDTSHTKYTYHNQEGIIIELGKLSVINTIRLLVLRPDFYRYSYVIEVSRDQQVWNSVASCSDTGHVHKNAWKEHTIDRVLTKFIRLSGTCLTPVPSFPYLMLTSFEASS